MEVLVRHGPDVRERLDCVQHDAWALTLKTHPYSETSTFDEIIDASPLLFRLHSHTSSNTRFDDERMVLLSSARAKKCKDDGQDIPSILKEIDENPSSSTPYEPSAVAKHITCWSEVIQKPSDYISLSSNICFVLWDWKRRRTHQGQREDDFFIIVLRSSELIGLAKLGTEIVNKYKHNKAYNFAQAFHEVIVADIVRPHAILGTMPMSQLENSVPSWWWEPLASIKPGSYSNEKPPMFRDFLRISKAPANKSEDKCTSELIRFALALIAPTTLMRGRLTEEVGTPKIHRTNNDTKSEQTAASEGGSVVPYKKRQGSSEIENMAAGMAGNSPSRSTPSPIKRRRITQEEQHRPEGAADLADVEIEDQVSAKLPKTDCFRASAADLSVQGRGEL